jgi:hypothetical protein
MIGMKRTAVSIFVSLILVGTAVASVWLMASAGVFTGGGAGLPGAPAAAVTIAPAPAGSVSVAPGFQVAQPRDPFEPLITTPEGEGGETTTTVAGATTTTVAGGTTTTVAGGTTTTTTQGDDPDGIRVKLLEVRNEASGRVAVVEVDGIAYTVRVGDTFATTFKVVSLTTNGGVFTYGDSAFSLAVGQSILK